MIHCQGSTPTQIHTLLFCQRLLSWLTANSKRKIPTTKPADWHKEPLAMAEEQAVTAGEASMEAVGEQRVVICPKGNIQDWQQWRFKMTVWLSGADSIPEETAWLDGVKSEDRCPGDVLFSALQRFLTLNVLWP